jgi:methionine-rich copper-binding protein CopC
VMATTSWTFTTGGVNVTARTPAAGATGIAQSTNVTATFDTAVTASTVKLTVTPAGGTAVAGAVTYSATTRTATFDPAANLGAGTFTVSLSGAADASGNVMTPVTWTFTTTAPVVTTTNFTNGQIDFDPELTLTAVFDRAVTSSTIKFTLTNSVGATVPAAFSYNTSLRRASLEPSSDLDNTYGTGAGFTASISGATDASGNVMAPMTWTFAIAGPYTVFPTSARPAVAASTNTTAMELGMRFQATVDGYITGVRFYKGTGNTGTHTGSLWETSGTRLATATFRNETATGWQQVLFAAPVKITKNRTYVISYYAPVGRNSYDTGYFTNKTAGLGPIRGIAQTADISNGVYKNGAGYPSTPFNATNFWVDAIFTTTP